MSLYELSIFEKIIEESNDSYARRYNFIKPKIKENFAQLNLNKLMFGYEDTLSLKGNDLIYLGFPIQDKLKEISFLKFIRKKDDINNKSYWLIYNMNLNDVYIGEVEKRPYFLTVKGDSSDKIYDITQIFIYLNKDKTIRIQIKELDLTDKQQINQINNAENKIKNDYSEDDSILNIAESSETDNFLKKKRLIKPQNTERYNRSLEKCSICLDYAFNEALIDCCNHIHCFECIKKFSKFESKCPLCKKRFRQITYFDEKNNKITKIVKNKNLAETISDYINTEQIESDFCVICNNNYDSRNMLICDKCNYHVCHYYCDGLVEIPDNDWFCLYCRENN